MDDPYLASQINRGNYIVKEAKDDDNEENPLIAD